MDTINSTKSCCSSGGGCSSGGCSSGGCGSSGGGCCKTKAAKLDTYDWLSDIPESHKDTDYVEVQFKNTRKGYYRNTNDLLLSKGDVVAVESTPGHDIGTVSLTGRLVLLQLKKMTTKPDAAEIKRVYRIARPVDIEKSDEAKAREHETMIKARKISEDLKLNMKIGDVEYQGDGNKAIFYYIADDRVDFRQLIRVLADTFKVRIEMKQIGARQEAGRIGGVGSCGRTLCCSSWKTTFESVSTSAARIQDISLNPQKLAGQCGKLKCCLNNEVDSYVEAQRKLPSKEIVLDTQEGTYFHFKTDIFKEMMTYSTSKTALANLTTIPSSRVFEIIAMNKKATKPETLLSEPKKEAPVRDFQDGVGEESLHRFDREKKSKNFNNRNRDRENQTVRVENDNQRRSSDVKVVKNPNNNNNQPIQPPKFNKPNPNNNVNSNPNNNRNNNPNNNRNNNKSTNNTNTTGESRIPRPILRPTPPPEE